MSQINAYLQFVTRRMRKTLLILLGLVLLYSVLGFWAMPALLRPWLEKQGSAALERQLTIGKIEINPFLLRATLRDVRIGEKDSLLLEFAALTADGELASIWRRGPVLREITLDTPRVHLVRLTADRYNFSDLLEKPASPTADADAALPRFSLNNIRILNGQIELDDRYLKTLHTMDHLQLALPFVSTLPHRQDDYIEPALSGQINGAPFNVQGQSKPFQDDRETRLSFQLESLDLPHYLAYIPLPNKVNLPSGKLSGQLDFVFRTEKDQPQLLVQGQLGLADGRLEYRGEPLLNLPAVTVELKELALLAGQYRFARINIDKPELRMARNAASELNWLNAFASGKPAPAKTRAPDTPQALFEVENFSLNEGRIEWTDAAIKPAQSAHIEELSIQVRNVSSAAGTSAPVSIAFKTGDDEALRADVNLQMQPMAIDGRLALSGVKATRYAAYLRPYFLGEFASGQLSAAANIRYAAQPQKVEISQGEFGIKDLAIRIANEKKPAIKLANLAASGIGMNLARREVVLSNLNVTGAEAEMTLAEDGRINLQAMLPSAAETASPAPVAPSSEAPWRIKLAALNVEKSALRLEDLREKNTAPLALTGLSVKAQGLDSAPGSQAQLALSTRAGKHGTLKISGPFVPQPFSAQWRIDVQQFDAAFAQPYFADLLNIRLASIWLAAQGDAQIATAPKMQLRYRGNLAISDLHAIDKYNGADFLKWRSLGLNGIDLQSEPFKLALKEVALSDFYSRLILSREGRLNLQDIVVQEGQAAASITSPVPAASAAPAVAPPASKAARAVLPPISIEKMTLQGGNINYTDNFIQPNFTANLQDMGGEILGLSSAETARASVDLRGSVDRIAPVTVSGSLNPLAQQIFLDIKAAVKGYELTAASTYSAKYAGYGIEKGKLSMDVAYSIKDGQLKANNQLLLDQLTLGEKVDSPDATGLPVKFALALLTDRRGQINMSLPIEGSLNDPQFRIGKIIWQVIGNVLTKAVTSPFSVLGSLLGGDEASFSRQEFEPGRADLSQDAQAALGKLAKALDDRPALQLEIAGWVASDLDREGLKREKLEDKIRARKLAQFVDKGQSREASVLQISAEERPALLAQVYERETFAKPRNAAGLKKTLTPAEMEALLLANTPVSTDDLRNLGLRRATVVKNALQAAGVDQSRLFMLTPQLDPPADELKKDGGKATRVQFTLK